MQESKYTTQRAPIFRETFADEQSVRANGGVPTAVTFANGVGSFNGTSSGISYNVGGASGSQARSIRIKFKTTQTGIYKALVAQGTASNTNLFSLELYNGKLTIVGFGTGMDLLDTTKTVNDGLWHEAIAQTNGTTSAIYVDGVFITSASITYNTIPSITTIGYRISGNGQICSANIEFVEIYDYTLSASEVKNLYEGKKNRTIAEGMVLGPELITNGGFDTNTGWVKGLGWNILDSKANSDGTAPDASYFYQAALTAGKIYQITFDAVLISGTAPTIRLGNTGSSFTIVNGSNSFSGICLGNTNLLFTSSTNKVFNIDNVSLKEILYTKTLDFDPRQGAIVDRTGLRTLTPTDVTIVRDGQSFAAKFNETSSRIDTGSDFIGVKPVTVCAWVKSNTQPNSVSSGRLLSNLKLLIWNRTSTSSFGISSDGSITVDAGIDTFPRNSYKFICFTRKADGKVSCYTGTTKIAPVLSGAADQNSGTPVAGTSNIFIGASSTGTFIGANIKLLQVYDGILDYNTIVQIYTSTLNSI